MSKNTLILTLVAHQPYIRHFKEPQPAKEQLLFTALSETYLPLLNMFANLESDGVPFKVSMVLSPSLCSMLSDPVIQKRYIDWLDKGIALGESEVTRCAADAGELCVARQCLAAAKRNRHDFIETFNQDILSKFAYYAKRGNIELLATAATDCFLPHYIDIQEALNSQIEIGLQSHRAFFDVVPEGFWLPHMGYTPGVEHTLRSYGFNYTILDSHALLFADPIPDNGIFSPVRCSNSLAVFARDPITPVDITDPERGYMQNPVYRNQNCDIGFDADPSYLANFLDNNNARLPTGYKYRSRGCADGKKTVSPVYDSDAAAAQIKLDARHFVDVHSERLVSAARMMASGIPVSVSCMNLDLLGQGWHEGIAWLEEVLRLIAVHEECDTAHCSELLENQFSLQKCSPFPSADCGTGYGENLLDSSNGWMLRYARKASERMIDLSGRFSGDTGLKARALNLAAKEVLLAQSSDWPRMVHDNLMPNYAAQRFTESINAFTVVYDSLGSNSISTEWLTNLEREHSIFPWLNYRVFSAKK
jgi:1,4-alpha-glucan branching enzyme